MQVASFIAIHVNAGRTVRLAEGTLVHEVGKHKIQRAGTGFVSNKATCNDDDDDNDERCVHLSESTRLHTLNGKIKRTATGFVKARPSEEGGASEEGVEPLSDGGGEEEGGESLDASAHEGT